ncbi:hypothetical protein ATCC90586_006762 [Pythium insidiosum]|nr:hypothetical protein ATCC90586_006762 [Pythium insidiosum]
MVTSRDSNKLTTVAVKSAAPARPKAAADAVAPSAATSNAKRRRCRVTVDITSCRYAIIRQCLRARDFRLVKKRPEAGAPPTKWDIWWSDRGDLLRDLPRLSPFQKVNHFPSMEEICRKDFLANNLNAIAKVLPQEFDFFPRTFLIPGDSIELQRAMETGPKNATYIVKPRTLCQGKGISLVQSFTKVPMHEPCVVQRYIDNPLLVDGYKFDLRVYVLVLSVCPLQLYIFQNGLARFCTTPFQRPTGKNLNKRRMHLTNYAINKRSKSFQQPKAGADAGTSKRSIASVLQELDKAGRVSSSSVWKQIHDIVYKTLLCVEPKLQASYRSYFGAKQEEEALWGPKCFEILGFDIMLDAANKAWLFEVNHAPSFAGDSSLDREIKTALINATLDLIDVTNTKKKQYLRQTRAEWTKRLWSTSSRTKGTHMQTDSEPASKYEIQPADQPQPDTERTANDNHDDSDVDKDDSEDQDVDDDDNQHQEVTDVEESISRVSNLTTALGAIWRRQNRIAPDHSVTEAEKPAAPSARLGNYFVSVEPFKAEADNAIERINRVRQAAQVNRSKLWA